MVLYRMGLSGKTNRTRSQFRFGCRIGLHHTGCWICSTHARDPDGRYAGVVCYFACSWLKSKIRYDDALDAFGVHGVGGTLGALLTGIFATRVCTNIDNGNPLGLLEGGQLFSAQFLATLITWVFSILGSMLILKVLDMTIGLRVTSNDERQGLDVQQHGEEGYIFL